MSVAAGSDSGGSGVESTAHNFRIVMTCTVSAVLISLVYATHSSHHTIAGSVSVTIFVENQKL
jgi:hypothetical protein